MLFALNSYYSIRKQNYYFIFLNFLYFLLIISKNFLQYHLIVIILKKEIDKLHFLKDQNLHYHYLPFSQQIRFVAIDHLLFICLFYSLINLKFSNFLLQLINISYYFLSKNLHICLCKIQN